MVQTPAFSFAAIAAIASAGSIPSPPVRQPGVGAPRIIGSEQAPSLVFESFQDLSCRDDGQAELRRHREQILVARYKAGGLADQGQ